MERGNEPGGREWAIGVEERLAGLERLVGLVDALLAEVRRYRRVLRFIGGQLETAAERFDAIDEARSGTRPEVPA